MIRRPFYVAFVTVACAGVLASQGFLSAQPLMGDGRARAIKDWQDRLKGTSGVRYTVTGTREIVSRSSAEQEMRRRTGNDVKADEKSSRNLKYTILLDINRKRFRIEQTEEVRNVERKMVSRFSILTYDGRIYQGTVPRDLNDTSPENPDITVVKGNFHTTFLEDEYYPIFEAHGIVPTATHPLHPDRLPVEHGIEEFTARGSVTFNGNPCLILRSEPQDGSPAMTDELWVDLSRQSAIARRVIYNGTNPWLRFDVVHRKLHDHWIPDRWSETHTVDGKIRSIVRLKVDSVEENLAFEDEDFSLPVKPGMRIETYEFPGFESNLNPTIPAKTTSVVDEQGRWVVVEMGGFTTVDGVELPPDAGQHAWKWIAGVLAALVVLVLVYRYVRRSQDS